MTMSNELKECFDHLTELLRADSDKRIVLQWDVAEDAVSAIVSEYDADNRVLRTLEVCADTVLQALDKLSSQCDRAGFK